MTRLPSRPSARITLGAAAAVAVLAYAWWATGTRPFTPAAYVAVGVPAVVVTASSLSRWHPTPSPPGPAAGEPATLVSLGRGHPGGRRPRGHRARARGAVEHRPDAEHRGRPRARPPRRALRPVHRMAGHRDRRRWSGARSGRHRTGRPPWS